ncbi:MAG: bifunctional phosphopantothenoylcysteine decarboxylase/phosphopantothenate--cysteine ligase CoaBC [Desulfurococcaceae archaeon]
MFKETWRLPEDIGLSVYTPLYGKNIVLGVTGSTAAYRSVDLARALIRAGASIKVVMTKFAARLVSPDLFHWATGSKPYVEMTGETEHIDLAKWADAVVIAPATLNTICKLANGVLDELLVLTATAAIGSGKKVIVVPAMNVRLLRSPVYGRCVEMLREYGVLVVPPYVEEDKAKYPPLQDLVHYIDAVVNRGRDLEGARVLVTAGPTREYIDPVRVLTNPSSGLMGVLVAREAVARGAMVTLVHGPLSTDAPYMVEKVHVDTTEDMARAVNEYTSKYNYDAVVLAAAPADYKPKVKSESKIPTKQFRELVLELESTPKVVKAIVNKPRVLVGFAAETARGDELRRKALEKISEYGFDIIVANNILSEKAGFGKIFLEAVILNDKDELIAEGLLTKHEIARYVVDYISRILKKES